MICHGELSSVCCALRKNPPRVFVAGPPAPVSLDRLTICVAVGEVDTTEETVARLDNFFI